MSEAEAREVVLDIGVEGGGATIYRTPLGSGGWQFHVGGSTIDLDENDREIWRHWNHPPVSTLAEALRSVAADGTLAYFFPVTVHPEYRAIVWNLFQESFRNLRELSDNKDAWIWDHRLADWRHACGQDS